MMVFQCLTRCSSSIPLVRFPPRRVEEKAHKERRLLMTLRKLLMYLKSLNRNVNLLRKRLLVERVVKKKVIIFANDNIILDPDVAFELGKSSSLAEAKEEEAAKSSRSVVIHETSSAPKSKPVTLKPKLKGVQSFTPAKKEAADIMQALKESKKTSKRQPGTEGSSERTGTITGVPDESTVVSATSSEGTEEDQLDDEEKDDKEGDADDEGDDYISDTQDTNDEDDETESDEDEIYKYNIRIQVSNAAKADAEKTEEANDDSKKVELPLTSFSLYISSGFVPVSVISKPTVLTPVQEKSLAALVTTLPLPFISTKPPVPQQTTTPIPLPPIITNAPIITSVVPESDTRSPVQLRVAKLEKDVSELKKIYQYAKALATLSSQVPTVIKQYLGSKINNDLQKTIHENKSFNKNPVNHRLYHDLMEALIEDENAMDKGVADIIKDYKRKHDDDSEHPIARPNQDKPDWNNLEGYRYPFDLSKPLPLQGHPDHLTIAADHFFNNDLEYLKYSDLERTYTTSITKGKAAWYEIKILGVKSVSVKKLHGYGYLEEFVVKRSDQQLCKFKEGEFVDLYLNDIKGMLLLVVQHKLFYFNDSDIVDFIVALRYNTEMSRRKWTAIDKKRSELMVELIDKQMRERRNIQNLERLVGARELEMDYKRMTRTI
uniref:Uncharacterized protein n=1 Tax=Tanacetum cinerariifolium TaxID=118510 RepID=A0A699H8P1_TANCI|nr:hypothetical protein [Tanacetum cinerariifolium]